MPAFGVEMAPLARSQCGARIIRDDMNLFVWAGGHRAAGTKGDSGVYGLGTWVEKIKWPDIEGAASEIDSGWSRGAHLHGRIIIEQSLARLRDKSRGPRVGLVSLQYLVSKRSFVG